MLLPVLALLVAAVSALAVGLDRVAGPQQPGSAGRGIAVGVLGTGAAVEGRWLRSTATRQELLGRDGGTWFGVSATADVPRALLDEAMDGARPMTDDEYDAWLEEVLPPVP